MSRASNLAGFTTAIGVPANLNVGVITATSLSGGGANLTSLPAGQLTGSLPAIDGSALTGISGGAAYNMIDNSEFLVNQRDQASYTTASPASGVFTLDRWKLVYNPAPNFEVTRDTDAPDGFKYSLKVENTSQSSTPPVYQYGYIQHAVEGTNSLALNWTGTAKQSATLSFYAKASIAGTWCVTIADNAGTYRYIATYTISSADTWERKTITISAPSSGTFKDDNNYSFRIYFDLGHGSNWQTGTPNQWISGASIASTSSAVNMADNVNSTFKVTGVQLEVGTSASDYVHQSYHDTFIRCQRYYQRYFILPDDSSNITFIAAEGSEGLYKYIDLRADIMRASPSIAIINNQYIQFRKTNGDFSTDSTFYWGTQGSFPYVQAYVRRTGDSTTGISKRVKRDDTGHVLMEVSADI